VKRTLAHTVTGIVLGIAIILIPLIMFIPPDAYLSVDTLANSARKLGTEEYARATGVPSETEQKLGVGGIIFPLSLLYAGFIFVVGLVSALGVYGLFKRRLTG